MSLQGWSMAVRCLPQQPMLSAIGWQQARNVVAACYELRKKVPLLLWSQAVHMRVASEQVQHRPPRPSLS